MKFRDFSQLLMPKNMKKFCSSIETHQLTMRIQKLLFLVKKSEFLKKSNSFLFLNEDRDYKHVPINRF